MSGNMTALPQPTTDLRFGDVTLALHEIKPPPGDSGQGFVPYYHFRIILREGSDAGYINFRVGDTRHITLCAGHIGFELREEFRGWGYAFQACRALETFVRTIYSSVILTCNPTNVASRRTIERLGAEFLEEIDVPVDDPMYSKGTRKKLRYRWALEQA